MMNTKLTYEETIVAIFGLKEVKEMKEKSKREAEAQNNEWKKELEEIMESFEENDIIEVEVSTMKHKILLDKIDFDRKPTKQEAAAIQKRIEKSPVEITIEELANYVVNKGRTFKGGYYTGSTKNTFRSSSLAILDIDNSYEDEETKEKLKVPEKDYVSIEDFILSCKEKNMAPALIYKTFSHKEDWHRYRVVFQLDRVVTSISEMDMIYNTFKKMFKEVDKHVGPSFLIHGGQELVLVDANATIKADDYIPTNISKETIVQMDKKISNMREVQRTTEEVGVVTKENLITPILIAKYGDRTFESIEELKSHLLSINLADLLRVNNPSKFNCIFHNDTRPSAGIIEVDGEYLYNCLGGCEHGKKDIYDIVAKINGFEGTQAEVFVKAQSYLMNKLNIKLANEEWMNAQFALIRNNRFILTTKKINKDTYPALAPRMRYITDLLETLLAHCEASVMSYPTKDENGQALFFISYNQLAEKLGKYKVMPDGEVIYNSRTIKTQLAELTMLGLIRKVSDEEVERVAPKRFKMSLKHKIDNNLIHSVQYYSIPLWNAPLLLEANSIKAKASNNGITSVGMTQRAASSIEKKISTKVEYKETAKTKANIDILTAWAKRTTNRKNVFLKDDFMSYAKKQGIGTRYASSILPVVIQQLNLSKISIKNDDIKKYSLSKNTLRKTAFIR